MNRKAFTLVELLVAAAVVVLLMVTMIGILSSATILTSQNRKQVDADSEARMIFDRMSEDFGGMIKSPNLDYLFAKVTGATQPGNDALFFYSEAPALADTSAPTAGYASTCALVGYRIHNDAASALPQLERLGKKLLWGSPPPDGPAFLTYPSSTPPVYPDVRSTLVSPNWTPLLGTAGGFYADGGTSSTDAAYYHVLGEAVFRLEYCFLLKPLRQPDATQPDGTVILPGVYSNFAYDNSRAVPKFTTFYSASPSITTLYGLGLCRIQAIVVALAILDVNSRKIVSAADLNTLSGFLADSKETDLSASPPVLMAQTWNNALTGGALPAVLKKVAANVHIYQRTFDVCPPSTELPVWNPPAPQP